MEKFAPDIIFQQVPYDGSYPKEYESRNTCRYAKVCYVPYGHESSAIKHLRISLSNDILIHASYYFASSAAAAAFTRQQANSTTPIMDVQIENMGFPRFDLYKNRPAIEKKAKLTFLYTPRWSLDDVNNNGSSFLLYKDLLLDWFTQHPECDLILRPHPLMFDNFIKQKAMTEEEIQEYKAKVSQTKNVCFDEGSDYLMTFDRTDVLLGDYTSLLLEYFLTGKPIVYLGAYEFNGEGQMAADHFYSATSWAELKDRIEKLCSGQDEKRAERVKAGKDFLNRYPDNIGESILHKCIEP